MALPPMESLSRSLEKLMMNASHNAAKLLQEEEFQEGERDSLLHALTRTKEEI
jgi:hypothetical protein